MMSLSRVTTKTAVAIVGLSHSLLSCGLVCIDCGEGKGSGTPQVSTTVRALDFKVSDPNSGTIYGNGCGVAFHKYNFAEAIAVSVPLEMEYLLEITSIRYLEQDAHNLDGGYYCQQPYEPGEVYHTNPECFASLAGSDRNELVAASLIDANGNAMASSAQPYIRGTSTDVERFRLRSHAYGLVEVSDSDQPCGGPAHSVILLANQSP